MIETRLEDVGIGKELTPCNQSELIEALSPCPFCGEVPTLEMDKRLAWIMYLTSNELIGQRVRVLMYPQTDKGAVALKEVE